MDDELPLMMTSPELSQSRINNIFIIISFMEKIIEPPVQEKLKP